MESWQQGGHTFYRVAGPLVPSLLVNEFVYHETPGDAPLYAMVKEITGKTAVLQTLKDYTHQKNNVWGITARNREQNFALNLLMNPEIDFVTLLGPGRHRQDAADAGRGPDADARVQGLLGDHHDPRHRAGRRGHRLPARHRGREDEPVDGRARGQPRRAEQDRRRGRRMGPRRDARPDPLAHQGQEPQLHARAHVHQQVPDHRRGAEPHAQADEDADHARRARHQGRLPRQHRADRHALPHRGQLRPHLRGRPLQGLGRTRATSRCSAASARGWPTTRRRSCERPRRRRRVIPGKVRFRCAPADPNRAAPGCRATW